MSKVLDRNAILEADDIQVESVEVPEWSGSVFVKGMTGLERDSFEASIVENRGKNTKLNMANIRAKLASQTLCDKDGKRLFSDAEAKKLGEKSAGALQRVFDVAQRLSGITKEDVEELSEGLDENPSEGSASD